MTAGNRAVAMPDCCLRMRSATAHVESAMLATAVNRKSGFGLKNEKSFNPCAAKKSVTTAWVVSESGGLVRGLGQGYNPPPHDNTGDWRSWLARQHDTLEVTGSSPVSPNSLPPNRAAVWRFAASGLVRTGCRKGSVRAGAHTPPAAVREGRSWRAPHFHKTAAALPHGRNISHFPPISRCASGAPHLRHPSFSA